MNTFDGHPPWLTVHFSDFDMLTPQTTIAVFTTNTTTKKLQTAQRQTQAQSE